MAKTEQNLNPSFEIETDFLFQGKNLIAGIDEAGRGSLAGPLTVAMVIFPSHFYSAVPEELTGIDDSKKLTPARRQSCYEVIRRMSVHCSHIHVSHDIIDELNINNATMYAVEKLIEEYSSVSHVLLDGNFRFNLKAPYTSVIKGDSRSISIAAASIAAKVERDAYMCSLGDSYEIYGFSKNAGYGTAFHREAIGKFGPSDIHRKSYEPCRSITGYGKTFSD